MILQDQLTQIYRIVLETSGASNLGIVESHRRDFAVYVSLSSRTNTRQGLRCAKASGVSPIAAHIEAPRVWGL